MLQKKIGIKILRTEREYLSRQATTIALTVLSFHLSARRDERLKR